MCQEKPAPGSRWSVIACFPGGGLASREEEWFLSRKKSDWLFYLKSLQQKEMSTIAELRYIWLAGKTSKLHHKLIRRGLFVSKYKTFGWTRAIPSVEGLDWEP